MAEMALAPERRESHKVRRTPALTARAREMFENEVQHGGWELGGTIPRIAEDTGLDLDQARDAIFAESADQWRRGLRLEADVEKMQDHDADDNAGRDHEDGA